MDDPQAETRRRLIAEAKVRRIVAENLMNEMRQGPLAWLRYQMVSTVSPLALARRSAAADAN
ncbi:hypothetical protein [Mesorhizobium sp.]|uniref:hypothetical protein n=1 Tax=Mesorhizobium sp. TaxID=1871066 RepID=UPI000FE5F3C1|nr:hypothetical protein [Mesorhizobium sp.]RWB67584.1 MAG: hypothetical protein EOQ49_25015 [Mesorhizobium sp.]